MADNDFNIIKPVENLQNVGGVTPAKSRKERKKRQNLHEKNDPQRPLPDSERDESTAEDIDSEIADNDREQHSIDYCA